MIYRAALFLFLFFTACLSGVKYADRYSQHYGACAAALMQDIESTQAYPRDRVKLLSDIRSNAPRSLYGKTCPALTPAHRRQIFAMIDTLNSKSPET